MNNVLKKLKAQTRYQALHQAIVSLFCHSPVFPIINIFYKGGTLGNTAFAHLILAIALL